MNLWQRATNIVRWYHEHDGATMDAAVNAIMEAFSIERDEYKRKAQLLREELDDAQSGFDLIVTASSRGFGEAYMIGCAVSHRDAARAALRKEKI